ncbi:uncharacterized protein LY89DRAFT_325264 [Mollisia scopiformis]|uniref:Uncharacterized protein n=1 Tax=Mollisia scopiformis TaxID=149040 RepID=A0A132B8J4_MOLSC|nr:uncharacterized protein LY89DRAFT_325264 [Mollisia scopiformis]KUJ08728.1 hypothetical protein LY89DRAFT_325264 [Mollisia scopiformis]
MTDKTPSPEQLQASSSKLKTQHEARSNGLVHSREVLKKRDVQSPQGYMESSYSPPSSALSLSYSASSASSLQRCSTPPPTTRTQVPCSELEGEEDDFCIANKPSIIPIPGYKSDNEVSHQCTTTDAAVDEKSTEKHNSMTVHSSKVTQTSASTMLHKEDPNRSSSPLHSERSTPDPDLDSISSYGSTHSEDESDDETLSNIHEDSATRAKYWKLHLDQQSLINVSKSALSNLPPEIAGKTLTALGAVFQSWMTGIESYANPHISEVPSHSFPEVTGTQPQNNPPSYFQRTTCDERKRKSKPESDSDQSDSDQSADENKHPRKRKRNAPFACPYYADDERYCRWTPHGDFSHCAKDPGFKEVHRVKLGFLQSSLDLI